MENDRFHLFIILCLILLGSHSPEGQAKILRVAIAGAGTEKNTDDIFSQGGSASWAWEGIGQSSQNVYLTYHPSKSQIDATVSQSRCQGIALVVNSWGALNASLLAKAYQKKCKKLIDLLVMIDGVAFPTPLPWKKSISAKVCVNIYQQDKWIALQGAAMPNCFNHKLNIPQGRDGHDWVSQEGSQHALRILEKMGY